MKRDQAVRRTILLATLFSTVLATAACKSPVLPVLPETTDAIQTDATPAGEDVDEDALADSGTDAAIAAADGDTLDTPDADAWLPDVTPADVGADVPSAQDAVYPPIDASLGVAPTGACATTAPEPQPGDACSNLGQVVCSNLDSVPFAGTLGAVKYPISACFRPYLLRCEHSNVGTSNVWVLNWASSLAGLPKFTSGNGAFTCQPESVGIVTGPFSCDWLDSGGWPCPESDDGVSICGPAGGMGVCGDPSIVDPTTDPADTNPGTPWCKKVHRWIDKQCTATFLCKVSKPGKVDDYFTSTCIQDAPTKAHCATSCEEMGLETAK